MQMSGDFQQEITHEIPKQKRVKRSPRVWRHGVSRRSLTAYADGCHRSNADCIARGTAVLSGLDS